MLEGRVRYAKTGGTGFDTKILVEGYDTFVSRKEVA
jgi:hypothetical protein